MKRIIAALVLLLCCYSESKAIFVKVSFSPWEGWDIAKREVTDAVDKVRNASMVRNTIELVNMYKDTKDLTGDIAATIKDMDNFQKMIRNDATLISLISGEQMNSLNEFFSWKKTLKGQNGESMLQIARFYSTVTNEFRDENGNLSLAQTALSYALSDKERIQKTRTWNAFVYHMAEIDKIYKDGMLQEKIRLAKEKDFMAWGEMITLNAEILRGRVDDLKGKLKGQKTQDYLNSKKLNNGRGSLTELEIRKKQDKVLRLQNEAAQHRLEAFEIYQAIIQLEAPYSSQKEMARIYYQFHKDKLLYDKTNGGLNEVLDQMNSQRY